MRILLLLAHAIEEYDQVRLLSGLGYEVFSLGGYIDPAHPHDPKRPALPDVPTYPDLKAVVDGLGTADNLRAAKEHIPDALIDWADAIIVHHYEHAWLWPQYDRLAHKRVIWRTVGQSVEHNESLATPFRARGLQIVRYSPKERAIPGYAGEDALIRFYKDPVDYGGWTGELPVVVNITQHLIQRHPYTNWLFWEQATRHLPLYHEGARDPADTFRLPLGPGSEEIGGPGELTYPDMLDWLRRARVYLYTGTQPASYTLGIIEAMMTGTPVVSIGPGHMGIFPYGPALFEGHELAGNGHELPERARWSVDALLADPSLAREVSTLTRERAVELFGRATIAAQWRDFLGAP